MAEVAFDTASHTYRVDGRVLPSVTQVLQILQDFGGVPADVLERAREFGSHVHTAVDLDNRGELDEDSLDPALRPCLEAWRKFRADTGAVVVASELRLADSVLGYAGTLDTLLVIRSRHALVDVKTGLVPRTVGPQLAAYDHLLRANGRPRPTRRLCVQLCADGYRVHDCKDPADWPVFMSALNCHKFMRTAA